MTKDVGYSRICSVLGEISVARARMDKKKRGGKIQVCVEGEEKTPENMTRLKILENLFPSMKTLSSGLAGGLILNFMWGYEN